MSRINTSLLLLLLLLLFFYFIFSTVRCAIYCISPIPSRKRLIHLRDRDVEGKCLYFNQCFISATIKEEEEVLDLGVWDCASLERWSIPSILY